MPSHIELFEDRAEIVTARGQRYVIDLEDVEKVSGRSWCILSACLSYAVTKVRGRRLYLHRFLLDAPKGMEVDHIDGDPANNRRSNLRLCTRAENGRNVRRRVDNSSGLKGVCWHKRVRRWRAQIRINGKHGHLGYFETFEQAKAAYDAAAEILFGDFKRAPEHE